MVDLIGPASLGAVTARPDDERNFGGADTFFRDCSSPSSEDGTRVPAAWLNMVMQQLRRAIRGMGIAENNADDDMLLKAIQKNSNNAVLQPTALQYLDLYPVIRTASNKMSVSASAGQVSVGADQVFVHRGVFPRSTSDYTAAARTFSTLANQTYHLRWNPTAGFSLRNVSEVGYNPGALPETNRAFDTTYDDMLVARVVTDAANMPSVTALVNRQDLRHQSSVYVAVVNRATVWQPLAASGFTIDWARTPQIGDAVMRMWSGKNNMPNGDGGSGPAMYVGIRTPAAGVSRYGAAHAEYCYDDEENNLGALDFSWHAIA